MMFEENIKKIIEKKFSSSNFILNNKYFEIHIESGKIFDLIKDYSSVFCNNFSWDHK